MVPQINQWVPYKTIILQQLLCWEYAADIGTSCSCGVPLAVHFYCCLECANTPLLYKVCIEYKHCHLHFHWIQCWNGQFFEPINLAYLKHTIYLRHNDLPCPDISTDTLPMNMVIIHTNGVHYCLVHTCHYKDNSKTYAQFISSSLWLASITQPKTVFTESLMKEWHLVWDILHQSVQDFFQAKVHIGNNTCPDQVDTCLTLIFTLHNLLIILFFRITIRNSWLLGNCGDTMQWSNSQNNTIV